MVSFICVDNGTEGKNNGLSVIKKLTLYTDPICSAMETYLLSFSSESEKINTDTLYQLYLRN